MNWPNKHPDNPYCTRPKDSPMRKWCMCEDCRRYEEEFNEAKRKAENLDKDTGYEYP
jgi:hypothetical protein